MQNSARNFNGWRPLLLCLLAPAVAAIVRKLYPGQPASIEVVAIGPVLLGALWAFKKPPFLPKYIAGPLIFWGFFQIAYALPSITEDWRIGAAAVVIRVAPMLMSVIAFASIRTWDDLNRISNRVSILAPLLLPVGLIVVLFGNEVLPFWLQPVEKVSLLGRDVRSGVGIPTVSAIFTTQWILSWSMLALLFLWLANLSMPRIRNQETLWGWLKVLSAFMMVYFSGRRAVFIGAIIGIAFFILKKRQKLTMGQLVFWSLIIGCFILVDQYGLILGKEHTGRSEFVFNVNPVDRLTRIYAPIFWFWLREAPMGNYLGFTGPEARHLGATAFRAISNVVEIGSAQLLAEMGILGAILMPVLVSIVILRLYQRAKGLACQRAVEILLLYQAIVFILYYTKELLALSNVSMGQFFFWAVPGICAALIRCEKKMVKAERTNLRAR